MVNGINVKIFNFIVSIVLKLKYPSHYLMKKWSQIIQQKYAFFFPLLLLCDPSALNAFVAHVVCYNL